MSTIIMTGMASVTATITERSEPRRHLGELLYILQFGDSALPVGGFSFSNGLEAAVQQGIVRDPATLREFVFTAMRQSATGDGIGLLCAHHACEIRDIEGLLAIDRAIYERKVNEETRLMTVRMGRKLCELAYAVTKHQLIFDWLGRIRQSKIAGTHAVSLAMVLATLGVTRRDAFGVQQYGVASTILSAALRLMRMSFVDTQMILLEAGRTIGIAYDDVADAHIEDMASFAPMTDILAAVHVKGHVRMFMN
jgi:urease accessory protein